MEENILIIFINLYFYLFSIYFFEIIIVKLNNIIIMGIGDWGLGPIPNPQSPFSFCLIEYLLFIEI